MSSEHIEKIEQKSLLRPLCKLLKFRDTLIVVLLPTGAKTRDLIEDSKHDVLLKSIKVCLVETM